MVGLNDLPRASVRVDQKSVERIRRMLWTEAQKIASMAEIPLDVARAGQQFARSIAPIMTGTLLRAIKFKTTNKWGAELRVDKATLNTNPYNVAHANYALIMHENNGAMGRGIHIHSGDPQFMFTTRDYLWNEFREKVRVSLGKSGKK